MAFFATVLQTPYEGGGGRAQSDPGKLWMWRNMSLETKADKGTSTIACQSKWRTTITVNRPVDDATLSVSRDQVVYKHDKGVPRRGEHKLLELAVAVGGQGQLAVEACHQHHTTGGQEGDKTQLKHSTP